MRKSADKLSNEKIQQLLAAVGVESQQDTSHQIDVSDYDWREPRYFNLEQLAKVKSFSETVAEECVEEFSRLYQGDCGVSVVSTTQHFSSAFEEEEESGDYYIPFGTDSQKSLGLIRTPNASALAWTGQVLGVAEQTEDSNRDLSRLEESFLLDIASGLIRAFSRAFGNTFHPDGIIVRDKSLVEFQGSDELFEITFEVRKADSEEDAAQASFLMCCDKLESVAGEVTSQDGKLSEAQIAHAILKHIHQVPVSVNVELGKTMLPFKDVVGLQANDIVVLNKKVTDPVDVLVENRVLFRGYPAQSDGKHAVVIV